MNEITDTIGRFNAVVRQMAAVGYQVELEVCNIPSANCTFTLSHGVFLHVLVEGEPVA